MSKVKLTIWADHSADECGEINADNKLNMSDEAFENFYYLLRELPVVIEVDTETGNIVILSETYP